MIFSLSQQSIGSGRVDFYDLNFEMRSLHNATQGADPYQVPWKELGEKMDLFHPVFS
jgi:hypothetical protein